MIQTIDLAECESTNDEVWTHLGESRPVLVSAERQSRGRGRQGRVWASEAPGNFYGSLLCFPEVQALRWVPLAAGVAAIQALEAGLARAKIAPNPVAHSALRLKWPNDVYIGAAKLGGVLCESRLSGEGCVGLVAGLGLNLVHAPVIPDFKTASVSKNLVSVALPEKFRVEFGRLWAERLNAWVVELNSGRTQGLRLLWLRWAKLETYSELTVHDASGAKVVLRARDLDPSGRLTAERTDRKELVHLDQAESLS